MSYIGFLLLGLSWFVEVSAKKCQQDPEYQCEYQSKIENPEPDS
jgi:hypothetical protein